MLRALILGTTIVGTRAVCSDMKSLYQDLKCCETETTGICSVYDMVSDHSNEKDVKTAVYISKDSYPSTAVYDAVVAFKDANTFAAQVGHLIPDDKVWVVDNKEMTLHEFSTFVLNPQRFGDGLSLSAPSQSVQITVDAQKRFNFPFRTSQAFFKCASASNLILNEGGSTPVELPVFPIDDGLRQFHVKEMNTPLPLFAHRSTNAALASSTFNLGAATHTTWADIHALARQQGKNRIYVAFHCCWCPYTWATVFGAPSNKMVGEGKCASYEECEPLSFLKLVQEKAMIVVIHEPFPWASVRTPEGDLSVPEGAGMVGPNGSCRNWAFRDGHTTLETPGFPEDHHITNSPTGWFEQYESAGLHVVMLNGTRETDAFPLSPLTSFMRTPTGVLLHVEEDALLMDMRSNIAEMENTPGYPGNTALEYVQNKC